MTATATAPTASVTLPIGTLQLMRVRYSALAALAQLDYLAACAAWNSPEGRARANSLPCGAQDAAFERREAMREQAESHATLAASIGEAITAAGYSPLGYYDSRAGQILSLCANANYLASAEAPDADTMRPEVWDRFRREAGEFLRAELTAFLADFPA